MKNIDDMSGVEKAAALFISLGPEVAADICKHLSEDAIFKIFQEVAKIEKLPAQEKEELIGEFIIQLKKIKNGTYGGEDTAKKLLIDAFGMEKAKKIFKKVQETNINKTFNFLQDADPAIIANLMVKEHPQTIAVMLIHLKSKTAADILKLLPPDISSSVALRIAKMKQIAPEAVLEISRIVKNKYDEILNKDKHSEKMSGINKIAEIMNHMNAESEHKLMHHFENEIPEQASAIKEKIYTFEHITSLSNKEIRILIDEVADDRLLALSLKGAGDEIRFKIFRNMSNNRAKDILEDMQQLGAVRMHDVLDSRQTMVRIMRELNNNGIIILRKGDETYIE